MQTWTYLNEMSGIWSTWEIFANIILLYVQCIYTNSMFAQL